MPRAAGQVDGRKSDAILAAAAEVMAERGPAASIEEIARRAGVSKQTVYNRYRSREELARALAERRAEDLAAPLAAADLPLEEALTIFAANLLDRVDRMVGLLRMLVKSSGEESPLAREIYQAGPRRSKERLAQFLAKASDAGVLRMDDSEEAAEFFIGMVAGHGVVRALLGAGEVLEPERRAARAREVARRFLRAYAP